MQLEHPARVSRRVPTVAPKAPQPPGTLFGRDHSVRHRHRIEPRQRPRRGLPRWCLEADICQRRTENGLHLVAGEALRISRQRRERHDPLDLDSLGDEFCGGAHRILGAKALAEDETRRQLL